MEWILGQPYPYCHRLDCLRNGLNGHSGAGDQFQSAGLRVIHLSADFFLYPNRLNCGSALCVYFLRWRKRVLGLPPGPIWYTFPSTIMNPLPSEFIDIAEPPGEIELTVRSLELK